MQMLQLPIIDSNANASTTYNSSEWNSFSSDTFEFVGFHNSSSNSSSEEESTISATLNITFDNYSSETSWDIVDDSNNIVNSGADYGNFGNGSSITINITLNSNNCYTLNFYDTFGDGICCSFGTGSYTLVSNGNTLASGGSFDSIDTSNFCLSSSSKTISDNITTEEELGSAKFSIYPNPADSNLFLTYSNKGLSNPTYIIYNLAGIEITSGKLDEKQINIENLISGLYIISIQSETKSETLYFTKN